MTRDEAIKYAKENILAYTSEMAEFKALAIEDIEKQMPKMPIYSDYDDNGFGDVIPYTAKCPVCGYEFDFGTWNENHHCICGQALDWSEERGE